MQTRRTKRTNYMLTKTYLLRRYSNKPDQRIYYIYYPLYFDLNYSNIYFRVTEP